MTGDVTVVVPAYQAEATIADALRSVSAQTHPPAAVVVVDDGSTDATVDRAAAALPTARVIRQDRGGPSAARNRGLEEVRTEWVAFLDADDRWHPDKLADQLAAAHRRPGAVLISSDWVRDELAFPAKPERVPETVLPYGAILRLNRFQTSTVLCRTETARKIGGFDPSLDGAEDWDMWLRTSQEGTVVKLDWPYVSYRDLATGYSKDLWRVYRTMMRMMQRERTASSTPRASRASRWEMDRVVAWHHLRFATAFVLARSPRQAVDVLRQLRSEHLGLAVPAAAAGDLAPFLARRFTRRLRARAGHGLGHKE